MFKNLGSSEIIIILLILVLLFGSSKISEMAKDLGKTSRDLKKIKKEYEDALSDTDENQKNENIDETKGGA